MKQRIITAVIALLALMLVLFVVPSQVAKAVIVAVILAGAWEWSAFLNLTGNAVRIAYVLGIAALLAAVSLLPVDTGLILEVSLVWWVAALIWSCLFPT